MEIDAARGILVLNEYRYIDDVQDEAILALYPESKPIEIDTNLDENGARALAQGVFAKVSGSTRTFSLTVDQALYLDDLKGSLPRYLCLFDHPTKVFDLVDAKVNFVSDTTVLTVRG